MKTFPILHGDGESVPWAMVEPHENQAFINHGQTLHRLAERGGLDAVELLAVLKGVRCPWRLKNDCGMALAEVRQRVARWEAEHAPSILVGVREP